ncbi:MAG: hypothetical protein SH847_18005 [Roseiflexaceae bacterium]|nr:hypothetical protein [Roseiflexaceae bacterium]
MQETEKLERGIQLLAEAGGDQDLLGVALLAFQGALDQQLRELLSTQPALTDADRALLADPGITPAMLVELGRRYGDLSREQAWRILGSEQLRVAFANGEPFRGSPSEVRAYGRFVAELCDRADLAEQLAGISTKSLADPDDAQVEFDDDADPPPVGLYYTIMRWIPGLILAALLLVGAWALFNRAADNPPNAQPTALTSAGNPDDPAVATIALDATLAPIIIAQATPPAPPTPTAATRRGRVVRLGGGPGWLHDSARFDSPTLPIRLSEGQEVAILGQQQNDAQGTPWMYVAVGGYEGWSPLNNIEEVR